MRYIFYFNQSKIKNVANFWYKQNSNFLNSTSLSSISFRFTSTILLINQSNYLLVANQLNAQFSYQYIVIIIFTYEKRLITYKKWFHIIFISENLVAIEFYHDSNTKYLVICSKCDLKLNIKRNSIKIHMRQSRNCSFVQRLNVNETNKITIVTQFNIQSKTNLKNLYDFFAYKEYDLIYKKKSKEKLFFAKLELRLKIKFRKFCKFEKFTINFNLNSISIITIFESIIKSNIVLEFDSKKTIIKIKTIVVVEKTIEQIVIEIIKQEIINFKNINFFDFIMQINLWKKFRISINNASFLYHLIEFVVKYKKKNILNFFFNVFAILHCNE